MLGIHSENSSGMISVAWTPLGQSIVQLVLGELDVERIGESGGLDRTGRRLPELPFEQRQALETARRVGYYETPRQSQLGDVAAELDLPLTTLRYRLRRAEAWGVGQVIDSIPAGRDLERTTPEP